MKKKKDLDIVFNLALAQYGSAMINDSRGDQKMVDDGREYIKKSMDFFDSLFRVKPNFPFQLNQRILYRRRIRDENGCVTDNVKWLKGYIREFGTLGWDDRPNNIIIKFDNGTSRDLEYYQAIARMEAGALIKDDHH